ncbi:uncharacterized protein LOC133746393 isoform X2 [Rosa rugosa]|uniref:uncharacterized protein LOC133746393 isoform X2 n=1 Tax=Rosa rugosa TaxID=74645 RepID=UPI002B4005AA|nr:uncharacterized protein LOC133746393 isoform X2 [Rosa rugosa]
MEHVATSTSGNNVGSGCTRDYTSEFTTTETFNSKEELKIWAKNVGKEYDIAIVALRSDSGEGKKKPGVTLACERSGKCDGRNISSKKSTTAKGRRTGTKKCDCPFRLRGEKLAAGNEWKLTVDAGIHNHTVHNHTEGRPQRGHSSRGRLSQEEKSVVKDMYKRREKPKDIIKALKGRDKHNKSTCRTIYNEVQSLKRRDKLKDEIHQKRKKSEGSRLQQLMSKAEEYDYIAKHRTSPMRDNVFDCFFLTHPSSFELLRAFPTVLIIRTQCQRWEWATVEFSGVTSTDMIFPVASAILSSKYTSGYEWALNSFISLRGVMDDDGIVMPDIVILDTYLELDDKIFCLTKLIKASNDVFSTAKLLFSVEYPLQLRSVIGNSEVSFYQRWNRLIESSTEADFQQDLTKLGSESSGYPVAVKYFNTLSKLKETCVAAWTDKVMHFGNTKRQKRMSYCNLVNLLLFIWENYFNKCKDPVVVEQTTIDRFWQRMHSRNEKIRLEIDNSFLESLKNGYINDKHALPVLKGLHGAISIYALDMIRDQAKLANKIDDDHSECSCPIKRTHGLPCAHEIAKYMKEGRPIPLECINSHWRTLPRLKPSTPNVYETLKRLRLSEEIITNARSALSLPGTVESERNSPNACLSTQKSQPGDEVYDIQTTKQLEFVDVCPVLRQYISHVKDVPRDGHCGFRAIAAFMGYSELVGWVKVREDLRNELKLNSSRYAELFGSEQRVNELLVALDYYDGSCFQKKYWMTMPDMGHIIASCYNVVLMHLSSVQCFTFFPLRTAPTSFSISSTRVIVIGFVEEHFVQVYLKTDHPMPPPTPAPTRKNPHGATNWERFHEQRSTEWATLYLGRIEHFKSLQPEVVSQKNPVVLDIDSCTSEDNMDLLF